MQLQLSAFAVVFTIVFASTQVNAGINITYNNTTGAYVVEGSDAGPGDFQTGGYEYTWEFGPGAVWRAEVDELFKELNDADAILGTAGGTVFNSLNLVDIATKSLTFQAAGSSQRDLDPAPLILNEQTGAILAGIWDFAFGTFVGQPVLPNNTTTDPFTLTIVPEPSSFGVLLGVAAVSFASLVRRRASRS
ncbi:MAG: PEP-CTERM sorting domain-containing protein [Verrucomicrobiota bacterium]